MKIALDTNAYTDLLSGQVDVVKVVAAATLVNIPVIVLGELKAGFACGRRENENLSFLTKFLLSPKVKVLAIDAGTAEFYARLFFELRQRGTPIPTNDLWIASLSIQHQLALCTRDLHFDTIPQLMRC
ncbi:MAG TPA: type II toxin-antitoxin system VapC family toxin [Planctomycetaceae bacterium]|nr:type II toxin-antitoxin system VapC family toxin [Planctomycetaceae bacterium]